MIGQNIQISKEKVVTDLCAQVVQGNQILITYAI